jgi:hypothetical protein
VTSTLIFDIKIGDLAGMEAGKVIYDPGESLLLALQGHI